MDKTQQQVNEALVDLQTQLAFQEDSISDLNRVISDQQADILLLKRQVKLLKSELDAVLASADGAGATGAQEPPPPHY